MFFWLKRIFNQKSPSERERQKEDMRNMEIAKEITNVFWQYIDAWLKNGNLDFGAENIEVYVEIFEAIYGEVIEILEEKL